MDPGNPEYRSFWLERARQSQEELGWEGVFIDNVEASLNSRRNLGLLPASYPDDASYQVAVAGFLEYLSLNYFRPQGRPMWANVTALNNGEFIRSEVFYRYLNYLDGVMIEDFAVDWSDGFRSPEEWESQVELAERAQDLGRSVILVAQGHKLDKERQLFSLASYLLANQGKAYFRYSDAQLYNEIWFYDNYLLELGVPLGKRYAVGPYFKRDFTHGYVIVDPHSHTASIEINP
jgi:hypothetical protein